MRAVPVGKYEVVGGVFYKKGLEYPSVEFEKARRLKIIAEECGFEAAAPVSFNDEAGEVAFEYIEGLQPIRQAYLDHMCSDSPESGSLDLLYEAGRVLACIHRELRLDHVLDWKPTPAFMAAYSESCAGRARMDFSGSPMVIAHCDYGFSNVCFVKRRGQVKIAVIDASPNAFVTFQTSLRAPAYVDLANFVACLEGLVPIRHYVRARWSRLEDVRAAFIRGYTEHGPSIDRNVLDGMVYATAAAYFQKRFGTGGLQKAALLLLFNRWKGNAR